MGVAARGEYFALFGSQRLRTSCKTFDHFGTVTKFLTILEHLHQGIVSMGSIESTDFEGK